MDVTALADGLTVIAVGAGNKMLLSRDGGESWEAWPRGQMPIFMLGITTLTDGRTLVAVGYNGTVLRSATQAKELAGTAQRDQSSSVQCHSAGRRAAPDSRGHERHSAAQSRCGRELADAAHWVQS